MTIQLAYPCGHTIRVACTDGRFVLGEREAQYVGRGAIYCTECWRQYGKATWKETGDFFMYAPLTTTERGTLAAHEATIAAGLQTFVEVGNALAAIRDGRLYRDTHGTFEEYCKKRWGLSRQYAYRTIAAAGVAGNLSPTGDKPTSERQVRPLAQLPPEQQREAWETAVATAPNGRPTGAHVAETVRRIQYEDVDDGWGGYEEPAVSYDDLPGMEEVMEEEIAEMLAADAAPLRIAPLFSSETDEWETPQDLFDALNAEFRFQVDVCATPANAKCDTYYTRELNGLCMPWEGLSCWCNPPYGREIESWMRRAHQAARTAAGTTVVCLVPARTDTAWWWQHCIHGEVRFLRGRLKFGNADNGAPFPSAVVVFRHGAQPSVRWWDGWR